MDSQGERLGGSYLDSGTLHYWLKRLPEFDDNLYTFGVQGKGVAQLINGFKIKVAEARAEKNEDLAQVYAQKIAVMAELIEKCGNAELIAAEKAKIRDICFVADNQLAQSHFLAGPKFSMADVAMITFLARYLSSPFDLGRNHHQIHLHSCFSEYQVKYCDCLFHTLCISIRSVIFSSLFPSYEVSTIANNY